MDYKYACSMSADKITVWKIIMEEKKMESVMTIPLDFVTTGDYKWWVVLEIELSDESRVEDEATIACCSSRDNELKII